MSDEKEKKMIKSLVAMAWADGRVDAEEQRVVEAMIESFGVEKETRDELVEWAKTPRTLDDVDTDGLTPEDADLVLHQSVLMSFVDGEQSAEETALLGDLASKLGMAKENADAVIKSAVAHAKALLPMLQS